MVHVLQLFRSLHVSASTFSSSAPSTKSLPSQQQSLAQDHTRPTGSQRAFCPFLNRTLKDSLAVTVLVKPQVGLEVATDFTTQLVDRNSHDRPSRPITCEACNHARNRIV